MAYKPSDVAKMLDVSSNTVRNWCDLFGRHLSAGASPEPGVTRQLDDRDVRVLRVIQQLRIENLTTDEIDEKLASMVFPTVEAIETQEAPILPATRPSVDLALTAALDRVATQQSRMDELDHRVRSLERGRIMATAISWVLAFALIAALVVIIILLSPN